MSDTFVEDDDLTIPPEQEDGEVLDLTDEVGDDEPPQEDDEPEVSFGEEVAPPPAPVEPDLIKKLRAEIRVRDQKLAQYDKPVAPIDVGPEPTLDDCYEADDPGAEFKKRLLDWNDRKRQADTQAEQQQEQAKTARAAFNTKIEAFVEKKKALNAPGFEAAEEVVVSGLSQAQQACIIKAADDSAKVIYALGRHPAKLAELAKIEDPIEFTAALVRLEGTLKVTTRRKAAEPDETLRGSAPLRQGEDKQLAKLEAEADRTGDRTKVVRYNREKREAASSKGRK